MHRLLSQLMQTEISDPRLLGVSITRVETTPSGHGLIVWIHHHSADAMDTERRLNQLAPHLMHLLRQALHRQRLPKLRFSWDEAMDKGEKVMRLMQDFSSDGDS